MEINVKIKHPEEFQNVFIYGSSVYLYPQFLVISINSFI